MQRVTVGRRRYSDPDVISLIRSTGELIDPRSSVVTQARRLNDEFGDGGFSDPLKRLAILASLRGYRVQQMDCIQARTELRDAVLMPTNHGSRGIILFNPTRPPSRVAFTIAHEIAHSFFPNSISGARFRSICAPGSREARELESLCDLAASELLMPTDVFRRVTACQIGLGLVESACAFFGSSYEATVFRLATAHPGLAAAGLLRYRWRAEEERAVTRAKSQHLLFNSGRVAYQPAEKKYRRQSFFTSEACDADDFIVRWNKSFDRTSCVYVAGRDGVLSSARESLPNEVELLGRIEAIRAPYQRNEADPDWPDVLFLWCK